MLVDTNTVDKTVVTDRGTVRLQLQWKNVDGQSDERVCIQGTSDGMSVCVTAEWHRHRGRIETRFSAPVARPSEFVLRLLSVAEGMRVPDETAELLSEAVRHLSDKAEQIE
eukprot:jgi/Tetstr1/464229/TSEL_009034.t1